MTPNFTDRTEWVSTTRPIPDHWQRSVETQQVLVLGNDLRLNLQRVRVTRPGGVGEIVMGTGWTAELFDGNGNHLTTVARSLIPENIRLADLVPVVLAWPWVAAYIPADSGAEHPFCGLA